VFYVLFDFDRVRALVKLRVLSYASSIVEVLI